MSSLNSKSHSLREVGWKDENQSLYNNSILALRELLMSREQDGDGGRITKSSCKIHVTRDGLKYYFVEVTDDSGPQLSYMKRV
jgi:hypothetical protein